MPQETLRAPRVLAGWRRWPITRWTKANVLDPCVAVFSSGLDPKTLAFSLAMGLTAGLFPICGTTSAVCVLVSILFRSSCHAPTMLFATFAATPLELILIVPYVRMGEALLYLGRMDITPSSLLGALSGKASGGLLLRVMASILAWLVTAPLVAWGSYHLFLPFSMRVGRSSRGGMGAGVGPTLVASS